MLEDAKASRDWERVHELYVHIFNSPANVCAAFKKDPTQEGGRCAIFSQQQLFHSTSLAFLRETLARFDQYL
jgi:hypothetical protein